ncbi:DUF4229 domain-containing protein [Actinomadura parmotrematis]|uniref:DUF4229 domain-containing protein n=1 Tax=Actinomadura parmotrematis TaxID=2864039 RepID=A0ABS7FY37_9ACTN|nr:DUF4229 domain-containing protein [Actinomadura parmotrematis]MBW8485050.1 DUF4229 domain-containing protein [Actinomadura parmotrematis]
MHPVLRYSLARLGIFAATAAVLWFTPLQQAPVFLLLAAVLLSGVISYVLLSRQRDAVSAAVTDKAARIERARTGKEV